MSERAHLLDRVEYNRRANATVQADDVCPPLIYARREYFSSRSERRVSVQLNGYLRDDRQIAEIAHGPNRLLQFGNIGKGLEHEQIDATFEQSGNLIRKHSFRFIERSRA